MKRIYCLDHSDNGIKSAVLQFQFPLISLQSKIKSPDLPDIEELGNPENTVSLDQMLQPRC